MTARIYGDVTHRYFSSIFHVHYNARGYWMLSPNGFVKQRWNVIGLLLQLYIFFLHCCSVLIIRLPNGLTIDDIGKFIEYADAALDIYYIVDFCIQCRTGYEDEEGNLVLLPNQVISRFLHRWLLPDILLVLPFNSFLNIWRARPALRLLHIKNSNNPVKRFFLSRHFRKELIGTVREFFTEKRWIENTLGIQRPTRSLLRRALRFVTGGYRIVHRLGQLSIWSQVLIYLSSVTATLRVIRCFSSLKKYFGISSLSPRYQVP